MNLRAACVSVLMTLSARAMGADIVVGQVAQIGDSNLVGAQLKRGAEICFAAVNRSGGIQGRPLRLVARNRESSDADALSKTRALLDEVKPVAMLNLVGTSAMDALVKNKLFDSAQVPVVGIRSGASSLHAPTHPWLFHTRANYAAEVGKVLRHFATIGVKRVAFVHESSPFGREVSRHVDALMPMVGLTLAARATLEPSAVAGASAVDPIVKAQPEAVLIAASSFATADFYKGVRAKGSSAHVIALSTTDGAQVVQRIGAAAAHGLGIAQVVPDPATRTTKIAREFQEEMKASGARPQDMNQGVLEGFIAAKVLVEGLRRAGPDTSGPRLRTALEGVRNHDVGGFIVSFSPASHSGSQFVDIAILNRDGKMLR